MGRFKLLGERLTAESADLKVRLDSQPATGGAGKIETDC